MSPGGVDVSSVSSVSFKSSGSSVSSVGSVSSESSESSLCGSPIFISDMMVFLYCIHLISLNSRQRGQFNNCPFCRRQSPDVSQPWPGSSYGGCT